MNPDEFEERLKRQPMRKMPPEWRLEILSTAHKAGRLSHDSRSTFLTSWLSTGYSQLSALLWPHPLAWAGLAAVWMVILAVNFSSSGDTQVLAKHITAPTPALMMAMREEERLLMGPVQLPPADRPKSPLPRPRSEHRGDLSNA
jgi:hypothetical protein